MKAVEKKQIQATWVSSIYKKVYLPGKIAVKIWRASDIEYSVQLIGAHYAVPIAKYAAGDLGEKIMRWGIRGVGLMLNPAESFVQLITQFLTNQATDLTIQYFKIKHIEMVAFIYYVGKEISQEVGPFGWKAAINALNTTNHSRKEEKLKIRTDKCSIHKKTTFNSNVSKLKEKILAGSYTEIFGFFKKGPQAADKVSVLEAVKFSV